jgi:hypothetical protein
MPVADNVKFFETELINGTGRYFNDQTAFIFPKPEKTKPSRIFPQFYPANQPSGLKITLPSVSEQMAWIRLVYFLFLPDGSILTLSFQTAYNGHTDLSKWAIDKIKSLDRENGSPQKLINKYIRDGERVSRGLDQDVSDASLIFFYVYNRDMGFYQIKFSCAPVSPNHPVGDNPFKIISSSDSNFFGLYDIFIPNPTGTPCTDPDLYSYKFNLHMSTKGYPGDKPRLIPFVIDPTIKNTGPA